MIRLHAFVYVTDMARSLAFYRTLLQEEPSRASPAWSEFRVGDARLALHLWEAGQAPPSAGVRLFFEVGDLAGEMERLRRAGVRFRGDVQEIPHGGRYVHFEDPDGHVMQLWEPARQQP